MNAYLTLALKFFCFLALLHGAQSQKKTKPTRLTGQSTDEHIIPVALLDQCFPYEEFKTFGLEFRLPEIGGRCDNGMLICYPSTLVTHPLGTEHIVNGMSVNSELFNVDSAAKNSLATECKHLLARYNNKKYKDKAFWHGIKVYTVKKSEGTIAMKLDMSLVGQGHGHSFEIPQAQRQFIIHFGNERELFTYVTIDKGEPVEVEGEKAKREAYKQLAPRGARLKDFVGFWTLGLDMLPWMNHTMSLHVQRSCDCFMEAWFIRPTDSEPAYPKVPTRGSAVTECSKEAKTNLIVSLKNNKLKADHLIQIRLLASKFTRNVTFKLFTLGWKAHKALMSFNISRAGANVFMRDAESRAMNSGTYSSDWDRHWLDPDQGHRNQSILIEFRIAFTDYSYGIMIGRNNEYYLKHLGREEFFPLHWWKGLQFDLMDHYQLSGEFLLLNDAPPMMPFRNIEENYKPLLRPNATYTFPVDNLLEGTFLTFPVRVHNPKNYTFFISLFHDRLEEHPTIGKTVLEIQVVPNKLILRSSFVVVNESRWSTVYIPDNILYRDGDLLEMNITVLSNCYTFMMNGNPLVGNYTVHANDLPIWATNYVRIENDIDLLGHPHVNVPPQSGKNSRRDFTKFTKKLDTLLNYNDIITIDMEVYNTSTNFAIYLMDESLEPSTRIGDVVLALNFTVNGTTSTQCQYHVHQNRLDELESNGSDFPNMTSFGDRVDNRLNVNGQRFNMTIKCAEEHFVINLDEVDFAELKCPYPTIKNNVTMPPWSVDHMQIRGDLFVHTLEITHPAESTPKFMMEVNHNDSGLRPGEVINVKINKTLDEERDFNVTVNLFYEALQQHELVGKTVMSMTFSKKNKTGTLHFDSYDKGPKVNQTCCNNKLNLALASHELDFEINVIYNKTYTTGFAVWLNDVYMDKYMDGLPAWAVHYITIETTNVELRSAPNITCIPKERCIRPSNRTDIYVQDGCKRWFDLM